MNHILRAALLGFILAAALPVFAQETDEETDDNQPGPDAPETMAPAAPPPPGGGSGPDPLHETYARQHIREDLTAYGVDLLGEQFDLGTGTLSFNHADVVLWIQWIDATHWLRCSAGVLKFNVFLGRSFRLRATALSFF